MQCGDRRRRRRYAQPSARGGCRAADPRGRRSGWPAAPAGLSIDIEVTDATTVRADPSDLFRILFNLVSNAVAVARETTRLTRIVVSLVRRGAMVEIHVADDGPGLPAAVRSSLFRPGKTSSGHGLAIARELAERSGGTLSFDPTLQGTAFVVTLPAFVAMLVENGPVTRIVGPANCPLD